MFTISRSYSKLVIRRQICNHRAFLNTVSFFLAPKTDFLTQYSTEAARDKYLSSLISKKDYGKLWQTALLMKQLKLPITNKTYLLLLRACATSNSPQNVQIAITLYYEAMNLYKIDEVNMVKPLQDWEKNELCRLVLVCLQKSDDFTNIVSMNLLWMNYISALADIELELLYHSTYLNILFNTHQNELAFEYMEDTIEHYLQNSHIPTLQIFKKLPMIRFLGLLGSVKDCDKLNNWIHVIVEAETIEKSTHSMISEKIWIHSLSIALSKNHYDLVKTIYDNCIMKDFNESSISTEEAVFKKIDTESKFFNSLNDEMVLQILHVFSSHGDVNLTLALIETHFLHKYVQGEKALSKDLCMKIIDAYCYNPDLTLDWDAESLADNKHVKDESVMRLLDVLNGFVTKFKSDNIAFSYKDISTSISSKFWNYHVYDENIERDVTRQASIKQKLREIVEESEEILEEILPKKISNANIATSRFGNQLANLDILEEFVKIHIDYLTKNEKFHSETITIFINCLLNHLALYQNFSAVIRALLAFQQNNRLLLTWLNSELYQIILYSMANSSAAKKSSLIMYDYLKQNNIPLERKDFALLISANLRGYIHDGLQYLVYEYLKKFKVLDDLIWEVVDTIPQNVLKENGATWAMVQFCKDIPKDYDLDKFWNDNKLCKSADKVEFSKPTEFAREYKEAYDTRDSEYLRYIFSL